MKPTTCTTNLDFFFHLSLPSQVVQSSCICTSAAPKEYNLHLKLQIQYDCVGALLGEGRDAPVLDDDRPPQRPRSRTPGLGEIEIENGRGKWSNFNTENCFPFQNLPFQIQNRYRLTLNFMIFFGTGFGMPFLLVRHQMLKMGAN